MKIIYPYNEILPKQTAHDVFIFHECAALAEIGFETTLLCGRGPKKDLFQHYGISNSNNLQVKQIPILRKNNPLNLSWNRPFFYRSQHYIRKQAPGFVFLSVLKQGLYHLSKKIESSHYIYEVHELSYYPNQTTQKERFLAERALLKRVDLITVTTSALKEILRAPPYSLLTPIEVLPLAVHKSPLPPPPQKDNPLILMYVGQLYSTQGLPHLLAAMQQVKGVCLKIIGGRAEEIQTMTQLAQQLGVCQSVEFLGFQPPSKLPSLVKEAHAFVAPFEPVGKMAFVAHTKLLEYAAWGRPFIAPNLSVVHEHSPTNNGMLLFEPGNPYSLAECIRKLKQRKLREKLQQESLAHIDAHSWKRRAERYKALLSYGHSFSTGIGSSH